MSTNTCRHTCGWQACTHNRMRCLAQAMAAADPAATWLMQAWMFYDDQEFWQAPRIEVGRFCSWAVWSFVTLLACAACCLLQAWQ